MSYLNLPNQISQFIARPYLMQHGSVCTARKKWTQGTTEDPGPGPASKALTTKIAQNRPVHIHPYLWLLKPVHPEPVHQKPVPPHVFCRRTPVLKSAPRNRIEPHGIPVNAPLGHDLDESGLFLGGPNGKCYTNRRRTTL